MQKTLVAKLYRSDGNEEENRFEKCLEAKINRTNIFAFKRFKQLLIGSDFENAFPNKSLECSYFMWQVKCGTVCFKSQL